MTAAAAGKFHSFFGEKFDQKMVPEEQVLHHRCTAGTLTVFQGNIHENKAASSGMGI